MRKAGIGAAILAALIGLGACGQRGPLYLPKPPVDRPQAEPKQTPQDGTRR